MSEYATDLTVEDIRRAASAIRPHLPPTPLRRSYALPWRDDVLLKLECWQPTGSFKARGALANLSRLTEEQCAQGIVTASAGNHALGVAFAAQALGGQVKATVFVPETAPRAKVEKLRTFPVEVREQGATYDDAHAAALRERERTGAIYIHAFDDPATAAGQGTIGLEILSQRPDVGTIVVPIGGGGLIASVAIAAKAIDPTIRIVGVQADASPSFRESLKRGQAILEYPAGPTMADGIAGGIGDLVFAHRALVDEDVLVGEEEIADAMVALLAQDQVVAEASGAVGVAALRAGRVHATEGRPVAVVITGANVDASLLARLLHERA
ncbi:MAG TPA: threonine/serine dehydratase [Vicinamibacteria bacterium]|nr:threonine/serine dehydratase [Vicinamibacteria bacterium]